MGLQHADLWMQDAAGERQLTSEGFAMLPSMGLSGQRVFYRMRGGSVRAYASGELWSLNLTSGEKQRALPGHVMANYSISSDEQRVVFTSSGSQNGDGVWIADLDRRTPPRQLTRDGAFRAFFGAPGEIVYMNQGDERRLYRMKEDGTGSEMIVPDAVSQLITVSRDGQWAVALVPRTSSGGGTQVRFIPLRGGTAIDVCNEDCGSGSDPTGFKRRCPTGARMESGSTWACSTSACAPPAPSSYLMYRDRSTAEADRASLRPEATAVCAVVNSGPQRSQTL